MDNKSLITSVVALASAVTMYAGSSHAQEASPDAPVANACPASNVMAMCHFKKKPDPNVTEVESVTVTATPIAKPLNLKPREISYDPDNLPVYYDATLEAHFGPAAQAAALEEKIGKPVKIASRIAAAAVVTVGLKPLFGLDDDKSEEAKRALSGYGEKYLKREFRPSIKNDPFAAGPR